MQKFSLHRMVVDELVGPLDEVLHVGCVGVSSIMLPPGEFAIQQLVIDWWHDGGLVVASDVEATRAEQPKDTAGVDGCHPTALMVEPLRIALLRHAIADEGKARRAESD